MCYASHQIRYFMQKKFDYKYNCKRNNPQWITMGKTITTYLIDGDPKGTQYAFISNLYAVGCMNLSYRFFSWLGYLDAMAV